MGSNSDFAGFHELMERDTNYGTFHDNRITFSTT